MNDPRIPIPAVLRSLGIVGGILMMILGIILAIKKVEEEPTFPQTGYK